MFGFGKKKDKEKKKSSLDKLVMGAIVGGAIGSVIGMSIAPQKGKETREYLAQKGKDIYEKGKEVTDKLQTELEFDDKEDNKDFISEEKITKKGILSRMKDKLLHRGIKKNRLPLNQNELKKIPHEPSARSGGPSNSGPDYQ